ncbi:hypothetical protein BJX99DRAFT_165318 [Aspergillus californicus]
MATNLAARQPSNHSAFVVLHGCNPRHARSCLHCSLPIVLPLQLVLSASPMECPRTSSVISPPSSGMPEIECPPSYMDVGKVV